MKTAAFHALVQWVHSKRLLCKTRTLRTLKTQKHKTKHHNTNPQAKVFPLDHASQHQKTTNLKKTTRTKITPQLQHSKQHAVTSDIILRHFNKCKRNIYLANRVIRYQTLHFNVINHTAKPVQTNARNHIRRQLTIRRKCTPTLDPQTKRIQLPNFLPKVVATNCLERA